MNRIAEALERHGNAWTLQTNNELQELYEPLHAARVSSFERLVEYEKGIKYGPSDRHRLDVGDSRATSIMQLTNSRSILQYRNKALGAFQLLFSFTVVGLSVVIMILLHQCMDI